MTLLDNFVIQVISDILNDPDNYDTAGNGIDNDFFTCMIFTISNLSTVLSSVDMTPGTSSVTDKYYFLDFSPRLSTDKYPTTSYETYGYPCLEGSRVVLQITSDDTTTTKTLTIKLASLQAGNLDSKDWGEWKLTVNNKKIYINYIPGNMNNKGKNFSLLCYLNDIQFTPQAEKYIVKNMNLQGDGDYNSDYNDYINSYCNQGSIPSNDYTFLDTAGSIIDNNISSSRNDYCSSWFNEYCSGNTSDDICACWGDETNLPDNGLANLYKNNKSKVSSIVDSNGVFNVASCFNSNCLSGKAYKTTDWKQFSCPYIAGGKVIKDNDKSTLVTNDNVKVSITTDDSNNPTTYEAYNNKTKINDKTENKTKKNKKNKKSNCKIQLSTIIFFLIFLLLIFLILKEIK